MAKNEFNIGERNSYTLQCGTMMTLSSPGDCTLQCGMWLWNRDSEFTTRHAAPCKLTRGSIWDDMPLNSPKTSAILEFYMVSISTTSPQSTCHSAPGFEILSNSHHPRQKKMTSCRFSRWRISYRSPIETVAVNCLVFA